MDIQKKTFRDGAAPQSAPYWREINGGHIGYRKLPSGSETWQARFRNSSGKYEAKSLGKAANKTYSNARTEAEEWFKQKAMGVNTDHTIEQACALYVENRRMEKGDVAAKDPEQRFKRLVDGTPFRRIKLNKLTVKNVRDWRDGLVAKGKAKNTANRDLRVLRAALNFAFISQLVMSDYAWKVVKEFPAQDGERKVFLTPAKLSKLIEKSGPALQNFLRALWYTGMRPGLNEAAALTVSDFDAKTRTITIAKNKKGRDGKARPRSVPLNAEAVKFFKGLSKGKLPAAPLLTNDYGTAWSKEQWCDQIQDARTAAKLPSGTVAYSVRHSVISHWLTAGIDIGTAAAWAGTSVSMIEKHYRKFIRSAVEDKLANLPSIG